MMKLDANRGHYGPYKDIVVIFNATNLRLTLSDASLQELHLHLHPVQRNSSDMATRQSSFNSTDAAATVAALTTQSL
jgi:pullulanase